MMTNSGLIRMTRARRQYAHGLRYLSSSPISADLSLDCARYFIRLTRSLLAAFPVLAALDGLRVL
jgi:hypothetical protein